MIQSVCISSNVEDLYYQNDIESQYSFQKWIQEYKNRDAATVIKNLWSVSDRQDTEEVWALYSAANYSITHLCHSAVNGIDGMTIKGKITVKNLTF